MVGNIVWLLRMSQVVGYPSLGGQVQTRCKVFFLWPGVKSGAGCSSLDPGALGHQCQGALSSLFALQLLSQAFHTSDIQYAFEK